jgi:hypothetical protein
MCASMFRIIEVCDGGLPSRTGVTAAAAVTNGVAASREGAKYSVIVSPKGKNKSW